jgi:hypothetical protein
VRKTCRDDIGAIISYINRVIILADNLSALGSTYLRASRIAGFAEPPRYKRNNPCSDIRRHRLRRYLAKIYLIIAIRDLIHVR